MSTTQPAVTLPNDDHRYFGELLVSIDGILWEANIHTNQFTYVSEQAERLLGYSAAQWLTQDFWVAHMHPDDREWTARLCALATREQRNHSFEYRMITNDGRIIWLRDIVTVVMEEACATKLRGIMVDVTARKRTEEALSKVERQLFTLVEHSPNFIALFDDECRFRFVNPAVEKALGMTPDQIVGKTLHELAAKPDVQYDHLHAAIRQAFDEKRPNTVEALLSTQSGERYFEIRHVPEEDEHGHVVSVLGITRDITGQKRAEEERKAYLWFLESMDKVNRVLQGTIDLEQMLRELLDVVRGIFGCDRAWLLYPPDLNAAIWPISMESMRPEYVDALPSLMPIDPTHVEFLQTVIAAREPIKFGPEAPNPLPNKIGAQFRIQATLAMAICPKNDQPYLLALHQCSESRHWTPQEERLFQEIGRRLDDALTSSLAYQRLQESELRYREVFEHTSDLLVFAEVTEDGRFRLLDFNPAWEQIMDIDHNSVVGHFLDEFPTNGIADAMLAQYRTCVERKTPTIYEEWLSTPTGRWYMHTTLVPICNTTGRVYRLVGVGRNITEQKRAEDELRASEARFRTFVDHAADAFFLHDQDGAIVDVNRQACASLGYAHAEFMQMMPSVIDVDFSPTRSALLLARLDADEIVAFDTYHRRKDGTVFPVEVSIRPFWEGGQRFALSLVHDITERKRAQSALTLFRSLLDHTNDIIEVIDPQTGRFLDVNEQACVIHGYTREEYLALTVAAVNPSLSAEPWSEIVARARPRGSCLYESQHRRKDGSLFPVEVSATYIQLERDYVLAVVRDITARKQAEAALKESEERYRTLYEDNPSMYFTLDSQGTVLSVNHFGAEQLGYTIDELTGTPVLSIFHTEDQLAARQAVAQCLVQPGQIFHWRLRKIHKGGTVLWVEETARAVYQSDGALVVLVVCDDITERKRTEQALVESHNLLHAIVEGTDDCVFVKDLQGRYLMMNRAGAKLIGRRLDEVIGKDDFALFAPEIAQRFRARDQEIMATAEAQVIEETEANVSQPRTYLTAKNVYRDANGVVVGLIGISREITELKQLEEQFRQAQKMDALGRLAGGVAHDFNNLLTVMNGYGQLLLRRLPANDPNRPLLSEVNRAGERAAGLTRQLLAFSRKQMLQAQVVDLNNLLGDLVGMLRRLIGENIELIWSPDAALELTKLDPGQFEQAIINLAVNARDAMPQGGRLSITTHHAASYVPHHALYHLDLAARHQTVDAAQYNGQYICVTISDTGIGMDEATKSRLFEPFFTTKEPGKGTGLGLSMVYGFVKQSGGYIEMTSEPAVGTTFMIYLPLVDAPVSATGQAPSSADLGEGSETVLLVEDEAIVRELVGDILRAHGYHVLESGEPEAALRLAAAYEAQIDLLLTDVVMPQMDGRQLAEQLTTLRAQLKVLYMSGYTENVIAPQDAAGRAIAFLQKPFTIDGLLQKVRSVLG